MHFPRFLAAAALALVLAPLGAAAQGKAVVTTERVRAELLAHAPEGLQPGKPVWVGLQLAHQPEWHTYWKNSGDSGLPTQLEWKLPRGVVAGDIQWPLPKKIPIGTLANYGYEGTVLLPVPLTITPEFKPSVLAGDVEIKLKANWLVCKKECIPEDGEFMLKLPARSTTALHGGAFDAAFAAAPRPLAAPLGDRVPESHARIDGQALELSVQNLPVQARGKTLQFFPETAEVIETAAPFTQAWKGAVWTARIPLSAQRSASPNPLPVVLADGSQGWRAELKVLGAWPTVAAAATVSPALEAALRGNAAQPQGAPPITLLAALVGALLGGLLLNLMPCVFPVLAIKVVSFTRHADDTHGHRVAGLAYTAGVLVSFVALGALVLALRAAGEQLGWGFQLQSPAVVATLAALFTLIALNLAGVFEFGSLLPSSVATLEAKHPVANSFLTGVLAVAVASPCTAPFMGASLGYAIGLPGPLALAIFAALGLGMALPYLAASWLPAVARALPRPGAWMETFRRLMAFPMFATVAWLVWVVGQQAGIDGAGALLGLLVALSMVVWAFTLRGRSRLALGALALACFGVLAWSTGDAITRQAAAPQAAAGGRWQPWEPGRVDQLLAAGQPVFVDFTAAWCVTCQYNKKTTLSNGAVLGDFESRNFALLRADWTRRDPAITAALSQLGRNGVPVYVIYRQGRRPVVLSEVLGVDEVRAAINQL
ncbi:protein-disulfide reductase [Caenimonas sedimenti]|uniref:Protein-disulfide reductase n=1 Tax=Caenimonas sedimenti TaxID=2596921 RepID=A0A562ZDT6_9BURK|nr:thioredoxin family protein [Caenimonas sedimenti]TWO64892.1 protein-disulfide reductase [Caenimonas sedimenti]